MAGVRGESGVVKHVLDPPREPRALRQAEQLAGQVRPPSLDSTTTSHMFLESINSQRTTVELNLARS